MDIDPSDMLLAILAADFLTFAYRAYRELYGKDLKPSWHHQAIATALANVGKDRKLCIFLPPRALKSFLVSVAWPAWMLGRDPKVTFLCASYGAELAEEHGRECMRLMMTPLYGRVFPGTRLAHRKSVGDFKTNRGGGRRVTSVGGASTGFGADFTIIDDPMKSDDTNYETAIKKTLDWYDITMASRGDDKMAGAQVLVMQRLHENDLGGHLVGLGWPQLCLPAINDEDRLVPISRKRLHLWRAGELLHPEHEPQSVLDDLLATLRARMFSAQYLQKPLPKQGNLIQQDWLRYYDTAPETLSGGQVYQSWDVAASISSTADFSACTTIRKIRNDHFVLDAFRGRLSFDRLREKIIELSRRWRPDAILIENTSSGIGMIQDLKALSELRLPHIVAINPGQQSKYDRVEAQTALIAAGGLHLPSEAPWLIDFLHEVLGFPNTRHDDMIDALAQALAWAKRLQPPQQIVGPEIVTVGDDPEAGLEQPVKDWLDKNPGYRDLDPWGPDW